MADPDDEVIALAVAIGEAVSIDWDHAEASAATPGEREVIRQLRHVAAIRHSGESRREQWGSLQLRSEIGAGTFGTVYRAWDHLLQREVALKLLKTPRTSALATVVKEARLLAQIKHPNVVAVYGADEHDGVVGLWMEFVVGRTLKEILVNQGPFGAHEAAVIGRDVCRALAAVHQRGFVHRDIKAQNVMREAGGRTVLMDFGAGGAAASEETPALAGSPAYLAPEVLAGAKATVASDIYSVGVLLYHLLSGEFPVAAESLDELRALHAAGQRTSLRDIRSDLPAEMLRAVDAATASEPRDRPATAGAFDALLDAVLRAESGPLSLPAAPAKLPSRIRRQLLFGGAIAAISIALLAGWPLWTARRTGPVVPSVAILPFKNLSGDPESRYFSEGVTADIAAHLATVGDLRVIAGASTQRLNGDAANAVKIGSELGVTAVLTGNVRRAGDRVRIVGQLIDAKTGEQLWSDSYDRETSDIFLIQSEVARKIAMAMKGEVSVAEAARLLPGRNSDFEAFNLYLKGRYQWSLRTEEGLRKSLTFFESAIEREPNYALAYAGLADSYTLLGVYGYMPRVESSNRAREAAQTAVRLDDSLAESHASLGYVEKNRFEWREAERSFRRAIQLKPGYMAAHHWYAVYLAQQGRFPEAITEIKTALSLDPLSPSANSQFALILVFSRRYDDAVTQIERTLRLDPTSKALYQVSAEAYAHKGDLERALKAAEQARRSGGLGGEDQELLTDIGFIHAAAGRRAEASRIIDDLMTRFTRDHDPVASSIATVFAALGDREKAFEWLRIAVANREPETGYLKVDPRWDMLRRDDRFAGMLKAVNLEP